MTESRRCDTDVKAADDAAPTVAPRASEEVTVRELLTVGGLRHVSVEQMFAEADA